MRMPGLTADASLYQPSSQYRTGVASAVFGLIATVAPQLRSVGPLSCYSLCRGEGLDPDQCRFACVEPGSFPW